VATEPPLEPIQTPPVTWQ